MLAVYESKFSFPLRHCFALQRVVLKLSSAYGCVINASRDRSEIKGVNAKRMLKKYKVKSKTKIIRRNE